MRISPAALLVLLAFTVPVLVELRTVLVYFDVQLSVMQTIMIGGLVIGSILLWAFYPEEWVPSTLKPNGG